MRIPRSVRAVAVAVFVLLALGFFAYSLVDAWHETHGRLPSVPRLVVSFLLLGGGLLVGAVAWARLLGGARRADHGAAYLVSQLGKYVPGTVWQAAGLVGLARSLGSRMARTVTTFTVMALTQAVAGCCFALLLALTWSSAPLGGRVALAAGGVATVALLDRRWMVRVLHRIPRTREASPDLVPAQRPILEACAANAVTMAAQSVAFVVLLGGFGPLHRPGLAVGAYAVAWTVGYLAVPVPSGLGIREAVLVAVLRGAFPRSVIVAASVVQRLVTVATEGGLAAVASHRLRPARLAAARAGVDVAGAEGPGSAPPRVAGDAAGNGPA